MRRKHTDMIESSSVECPACGHRWQPPCAFEMREGSEAECPSCDAVLECVETDVVRYWCWAVAREPEPRPTTPTADQGNRSASPNGSDQGRGR